MIGRRAGGRSVDVEGDVKGFADSFVVGFFCATAEVRGGGPAWVGLAAGVGLLPNCARHGCLLFCDSRWLGAQ